MSLLEINPLINKYFDKYKEYVNPFTIKQQAELLMKNAFKIYPPGQSYDLTLENTIRAMRVYYYCLDHRYYYLDKCVEDALDYFRKYHGWTYSIRRMENYIKELGLYKPAKPGALGGEYLHTLHEIQVSVRYPPKKHKYHLQLNVIIEFHGPLIAFEETEHPHVIKGINMHVVKDLVYYAFTFAGAPEKHGFPDELWEELEDREWRYGYRWIPGFEEYDTVKEYYHTVNIKLGAHHVDPETEKPIRKYNYDHTETVPRYLPIIKELFKYPEVIKW